MIQGAYADTGVPCNVLVTADCIADAEHIALGRGIYISKIEKTASEFPTAVVPQNEDSSVAPRPISTSSIRCLKCGSTHVQLISVTKRQLGAAVFTELLIGTAAGVAAGQKSIVLNTCMNCSAQWTPGSSLTVEDIQKEEKEKNDKATVGCVVVAVIIMLIICLLGSQG